MKYIEVYAVQPDGELMFMDSFDYREKDCAIALAKKIDELTPSCQVNAVAIEIRNNKIVGEETLYGK